MYIRGPYSTASVAGLEMFLVASSDMFSEHEANIDVSYYKAYYNNPPKIKLKLYARGFEENHVEEKLIFEELPSSGLYAKTFRNSVGSVVIYMGSGISRAYIDDLIKFVKYARLFPSQTDFIPNHSAVLILI
jgi:hypothetical protein